MVSLILLGFGPLSGRPMEDHLSQHSKSKSLNPKSGQGLRIVSNSPFSLKLHRPNPLRGHALPKPVVTPVHSVNTNERTTKNRALLKGTPPPLKHVQGVLFATNAVVSHPVGDRLQKFWQAGTLSWLGSDSGPNPKRSYNLPFKVKPTLMGHPLIRSRYAKYFRNTFPQEAVHYLQSSTSLTFYNHLSLVLRPNNKWPPILDLCVFKPVLENKFAQEGNLKVHKVVITAR